MLTCACELMWPNLQYNRYGPKTDHIWLDMASKVLIILQKNSYTVPSFPVVTHVTAMLREVSNRFWAITAPEK